jgi:glutamate-ammonia-ligase adenylyltransferase
LADNVGNIALLMYAESAGLLPTGMGHAAADAYRELRHLQHHARLDEAPGVVPMAQVSAQQAAIEAVWRFVFS